MGLLLERDGPPRGGFLSAAGGVEPVAGDSELSLLEDD
jgi:hypothetical protein